MSGERRKIAFGSSIHAIYRAPLFTSIFCHLSHSHIIYCPRQCQYFSTRLYRPLDRKEDTKEGRQKVKRNSASGKRGT